MARFTREAVGQLSEPRQHGSHRRDRVEAQVGPRAVRGAPARLDLKAREALVRDADPLVGGLADDRGVGAVCRDEPLGPGGADTAICCTPATRAQTTPITTVLG